MKKKLLCNKCGKQIKVKNNIAKEGIYQIQYEWGYFSGKDGQIHRICLCEKCYDKMVEGFAISPEIRDNTEFV